MRAGQAKRGLSADVVDHALAADEQRRSSIAEYENRALRVSHAELDRAVALYFTKTS